MTGNPAVVMPLLGGHRFDPSYATRPGEPLRCVCGRDEGHPVHKRETRREAA